MTTHFNATELIPIKNNRRTKKVAHFLDDNRVTLTTKPLVTYGRNAYTELPIECLREYLLWLTPKTKAAILNGTDPQVIVNNIKTYW